MAFFTNYIQQITATNGTTHDLVDSSASHYVKGTQTGSTNAWTGALPDGVTAYYDGLSIDYFLPYAGTSSGATLNLGSKGAKPVYIGNSTTQVTTHYPQYSVIHLTYIVNSGLNSGNGAWKATGFYNTNSGGTITGSGTSGYLTKWGGGSSITNGPQLGSSTSTFLRNDGSWETPPGSYSLPLASSSTRGGVKIGYSESGTNYAVKLSSEQMYVTVPWTDTKVTVAENTKSTKYYPILASGTGTATRQIDTNDKLNSETASGLYYQNAQLGTPGLYVGDIEYTITNSEYTTIANALDALV